MVVEVIVEVCLILLPAFNSFPVPTIVTLWAATVAAYVPFGVVSVFVGIVQPVKVFPPPPIAVGFL